MQLYMVFRIQDKWIWCLALVLASMLLSMAEKAQAASVWHEFLAPIPSYSVTSNSETYNQVSGPIQEVKFRVNADAGIAGKVKKIAFTSTGSIKIDDDTIVTLAPSQDYKLYKVGFREKKATLLGAIKPSSTNLMSACNLLADKLRDQGLSNQAIFSQDRALSLKVFVNPQAEMTLPTFVDSWGDIQTVNLICKKWAGSTGQGQNSNIQVKQGVTASSLALTETYSQSVGFCKVKLSGQIATTQPSMQISFRYVHNDGEDVSDIKSVVTGADKLATFNHEYNIPNGPGQEVGAIRVVGVSHPFETNQVIYSMNCVDALPSGTTVTGALLPDAAMQVNSHGQPIVLNGHKCPTKLHMQGKIIGKGGSISGHAYFISPGYNSAYLPYLVSGNNQTVVNIVRPLQWPADIKAGMTTQGPASPLKSQTVNIGFTVLGENNTVIAQVPQQPFVITCEPPPPLLSTEGKLSATQQTKTQIGTPIATAKISLSHEKIDIKQPQNKAPQQTKTKSNKSHLLAKAAVDVKILQAIRINEHLIKVKLQNIGTAIATQCRVQIKTKKPPKQKVGHGKILDIGQGKIVADNIIISSSRISDLQATVTCNNEQQAKTHNNTLLITDGASKESSPMKIKNPNAQHLR